MDGHPWPPTDWSRDGRRLAGFVVTENGSPAGTGVYDLASATMTIVSADDTGFVRWLPDGRRIVYVEAIRNQLIVVDTDTRARIATAVKSPLVLSASLLAVAMDGRTVFGRRPEDGSGHLTWKDDEAEVGGRRSGGRRLAWH